MAFRLRYAAVLAALLTSCCEDQQMGRGRTAMTATAVEPAELPVHGEVYIPIYSRIYSGPVRMDLTATLRISNADSVNPLILLRVDYYDSLGEKIREYLDTPAELAPLATVHFSIDLKDRAGGSGANFIVAWGAREPIAEPVIEAIMLGPKSMSFASPGRPVKRIGKTE